MKPQIQNKPFGEDDLTIDPSLERYTQYDPFPEKTARAKKMLEGIDLPKMLEEADRKAREGKK